MSSFPATLFLRSATATANEFKIDAGKTLTVVKNAVNNTDAVNKHTLDTVVTSNYDALKLIINSISGSTFALDGAYDTLPEMLAHVNSVAGDLAAEVTARGLAVAAEVTNRVSAVAAEATARAGDVAILTASLVSEVSSRSAGDVALQAQIHDSHIVPYSPIVFGKADRPELIPPMNLAAGHQGWYYKNDGPPSKINWYPVSNVVGAGPALRFKATVADINELAFSVTMFSKISLPFITVYTKPTLAGPNSGSWYKNRKQWGISSDDASVLTEGEQYLLRAKMNTPALTTKYADHTILDLVVTPQNSNTAFDLPENSNDEILMLSIGTNSGAAAGNVELSVRNFEIRSSTKGNKKLTFLYETVTNAMLVNEFFPPSQAELAALAAAGL
jgi:hypothetical protein